MTTNLNLNPLVILANLRAVVWLDYLTTPGRRRKLRDAWRTLRTLAHAYDYVVANPD